MPTSISFDDVQNAGQKVLIAPHAQTVVNPGPSPGTATVITPDGQQYQVTGAVEDVRTKIQAAAAQLHESGERPQRNTPQS